MSISKQLNRIESKIDKMAESQSQFDAELATFLTDLTAQVLVVNTTVQAILDKNVAAGNPLDLTAESTQLATAKTTIDGLALQLPTTPTPVVPPGG